MCAVTIMSLSPEASRLLKRLCQIERFKKYTLSGIYDKDELDFVKDACGRYPVVRGVDMMRYSPVYVKYGGANGDEVSAYIADSAAHGFVNTASWHWCPSLAGVDQGNYYNSFYKLDMDPLADLDALRGDIDAVAEPLKKFQAAGLPVLWRPLHEVTQSPWFFWSKDANTFKTLWNLMYERLTLHHGLDNLLWVFNPAHNYDLADASFYPGDDKVHVTAIDYPADPVAAYRGLKGIAPSKPAAVAEISFGDWAKLVEHFSDAPFSYVVCWANDQGAKKAGADAVRAVYENPVPRTLPWT